MKLNKILSQRVSTNQCYAFPIIYEWEDDLSEAFEIPIISYACYNKILNGCNIHIPTSIIGPFRKTFRFVTNGRCYDNLMNTRHIVPCIIDFFEKEDKLQEFYAKHSKNKIVLVSSPFDYQYLKEKNCPINIGLFPYSLSEKWAIIGKKIKKKYDIVLTGRQDPLLYSFFVRYIKEHPNVTYVKRGKYLENDTQKTSAYYLNCKDYIGTVDTREEFMRLQAEGKVTLYGLQGYDENTKDFFHITPHFLEIIACCSHVIARYPTGSNGIDAQFYEMDKFSPSVSSYEEFEIIMDNALETDVDMDKYSKYLSKHYTSVRCEELKNILESI